MTFPSSALWVNYQRVRERIHTAMAASSVSPQTVTLLAVSKTQTVETISELYSYGQVDFGENYLQEALEKQQRLKNTAIQWHYIGAIQSNKTRDIAENFAWVHTVDREKMAQRLHRHRPEALAPLQVCIQVNANQEAQKSGVEWSGIPDLAKSISRHSRLTLRGLMAIPARGLTPQAQGQTFASLYREFQTLQAQYPQVDTLSMGMSEDLEAAIQAGATCVRIGTALFGPRVAKK